MKKPDRRYPDCRAFADAVTTAIRADTGRITDVGVRASTGSERRTSPEAKPPKESRVTAAARTLNEQRPSRRRTMVADEPAEINEPFSLNIVGQTERAFVYFDISEFSRSPAGQQALIITSLTSLTSDSSHWRVDSFEKAAFERIQARLCIGDGYIFCFDDSITATYFAARLAAKIEEAVADKALPVCFHFRAGVHVGPVYHFWDYGRGDWNYIGDGINGGSRVLEAIGKKTDDVVFVSDDVRNDILQGVAKWPKEKIENLKGSMQNRGRREDSRAVALTATTNTRTKYTDNGVTGFIYDVVVTFGQPDAGEEPGNPFKPAEFTWSFDKFEEVVDFDIDGTPILNSAKDPYDPPVVRDVSRLRLSVVQNEQNYNPALALLYHDRTNSDAFQGAAAGQIKCENIGGSGPHFDGDIRYYTVNYEFAFKRDGWKKEILDAGMREIGSDGKKQNIQLKGQAVSNPHPLDGSGKATTGNGVKRTHEVYKQLPFNSVFRFRF